MVDFSPPDPADCVRQYPTISVDVVELVAFDWQGIVRAKLEVSALPDAVDDAHVFLLRLVREHWPKPPPVRLI